MVNCNCISLSSTTSTSTRSLMLRSTFMVLLLLTVMVTEVKAGKRQKALFSLEEDNGRAGTNTNKPLKKDQELNTLLQQTKENLIKAFGLRENMVNAGNSIRKREPHKYMTYIAKKYEDTYKRGIPLTANTVRGCVDIGKNNLLLFLFALIPTF